jgi:hypothetical protein
MATATPEAMNRKPTTRIAKEAFSSKMPSVTPPKMKVRTNRTAPMTTHLTCWRSSPCECRKRTTSEASARQVVTNQSTSPTPTIRPAAAGVPNGLSTGYSCNRPGRNTSTKRTRTTVTAAIQVTGRQRGDGGRPVGKSTGNKVTVGIRAGTQVQLANHATIAAVRSDPTSWSTRAQ